MPRGGIVGLRSAGAWRSVHIAIFYFMLLVEFMPLV